MFKELAAGNIAARKIMLAGCAALVVLSFGFNVKAEARMDVGDRMTATAQECGYYQDQYDKAKASGDQSEMSRYAGMWNATVPGCSKYYGGIAKIKAGLLVDGAPILTAVPIGGTTPQAAPVSDQSR